MTDAEIIEVIHQLADQPDQARARIRRMNGLERMTLRSAGELLVDAVKAAQADALHARDRENRRAA